MYYAIGVSAPSLDRESTDSLIHSISGEVTFQNFQLILMSDSGTSYFYYQCYYILFHKFYNYTKHVFSKNVIALLNV